MNFSTIYQLLETEAKYSPESIAVLAPGRPPLSYGRLLSQVQEVACYLNASGIGRNDRVAIVLPDGPEMLVAFLSVAAVATSAPLNPRYRAPEFEFYLSDLRSKALVVLAGTNSPAVEVARNLAIGLIEITPLAGEPAGLFTMSGRLSPRDGPTGFAGPDEVALVLHTSGTTSRPKIVPLTQVNICASACSIRNSLELAEGDRCLGVMPLFHVHGLIGAALSSFAAGASIICSPRFDELKFFEWMDVLQPTWYTAVPTMHQTVLAHGVANPKLAAKQQLRFIRSCSASLSPRMMADLENLFKTPVIEAYGMTEASHQMTSNPLPPRHRKAGSVGVAAGSEVAIMDEEGNLLKPGITGEIVIRGASVTRGYENNPKANEDSFTNGWFRTGDQGIMDTEGYLIITGRIKEMINRGGEKIAPREIDDRLMEHPAIAQAVTFALPHPTLGEDIAAAVVLKEEGLSTGEREILEFLFGRLADCKLPSQVVIVDQIPKGPTGKVQRIGLADKLSEKLKKPFVAPRTPVEETLAKIWIDVLGCEQVGVYDNFFALGGDSLKATLVVSRVQKAFDVTLTLKTFFLGPTVADLAIVIEDIILDQIEKMTDDEAGRLSE